MVRIHAIESLRFPGEGSSAQQVDRVPYMLVLGAKEAEAGNISVRDRKGETTEMSLEDFIAKVTTEIRTRSL